MVAGVEAGKSGHHVDGGGDHRDDEGVADARVLEVLGSVVKDEVDTRQLLQGLDAHASELSLAHSATEAVDVAGLPEGELELVIGFNLPKFLRNGWVVFGEPAEFAEGDSCLVHAVALDEIPWCFGEQKHSHNQDDGPSKLDRNGYAV